MTKQDLPIFLFFILLSVMALGDPGDTGLQISTNNTTEDVLSNNDINSTSVIIPSERLRRTKDGGIFFNFGGNGGNDPDDMFKRKPRPYVDGESLWSGNVESLEDKISDLLDYIERLLNNPETELTPGQLTSALDELEAINDERHRRESEKQSTTAEMVSGHSALEGDWRYTHYPGYQEHHPAHPHHQPYVVPGIVETPVSKGAGANSRHHQATSSQNSGAESSASNASGARKKPAKGSSGGNGSRPPKKPRHDEESLVEVNEPDSLIVRKEIIVDGKTYTLETVLTGTDTELFCLLCRGLVSYQAVQCQGCGSYFCTKEFEQLQTFNLQCPGCRANTAGFSDVMVRRRINRLRWPCPKGCGSTYDLVDIRTHIPRCNGGGEYECENSGCEYTDSYSAVQTHERTCGFALVECSHEGCQKSLPRKNIEKHESTCQWRLVDLGPIRIPSWQKNLIDRNCIDISDSVTPDDVQAHDSAHFCVSLLVQLLCSSSLQVATPETETGSSDICSSDICSSYICNYGCHYEADSCQALDNHYSTHCPFALVACPFCPINQARNSLQAHMKVCDYRPVNCSYGCRAEGLVALDLSTGHHFKTCKKMPITCEYCDQSGIERGLMDDHRITCPLKSVMKVGSRMLYRRTWATGAIYHHNYSGYGGPIYFIIPTTLIRKVMQHCHEQTIIFSSKEENIYITLKSQNTGYEAIVLDWRYPNLPQEYTGNVLSFSDARTLAPIRNAGLFGLTISNKGVGGLNKPMILGSEFPSPAEYSEPFCILKFRVD